MEAPAAQTAEMAQRHARNLGELAEMGMSLARDLHARALAAETPRDAAEFTAGFHRIARSARQCMALEARLLRDAHRHDKEAAREAKAAAHAEVTRRKDRIETAVSRLIWTESERDEDDNEELEEKLQDLLWDDLPDLPDQAIVAQLAAALDVSCSSPVAQTTGEAAAQRAEGASSERNAPPRKPIGLPGEYGPNGETGPQPGFWNSA